MTQEETDIKRLRKETGLDIVEVAYKDGKFLLGQQENPPPPTYIDTSSWFSEGYVEY